MDITLGAPALPGVTAGGRNETVAPAGSPVAESATRLLKLPPSGAIVRLYWATAPGWMLAEGVEELTTYVPAEPIPEMAADCGEPAALSATEIAALKVAADAGVKVTVIVQVAPAASEAGQLLVWPKLLALVPVTEMLVMMRGVLPGLDSAMGRGAAEVLMVVLGKVSEVGPNTACGISGSVPVQVMVADCGEPVALSATEIEAVRLAAEAGVNVTVIVQVAPAASEIPQLLDSPKLLAFVPVTEMLEMVRAAVPGLDSVMGKAVAGVPTRVLGKASGLGASTACG
jgi:hypothetical protein